MGTDPLVQAWREWVRKHQGWYDLEMSKKKQKGLTKPQESVIIMDKDENVLHSRKQAGNRQQPKARPKRSSGKVSEG